MRLTPDHPDFERTVVFLDNRILKTYIAADDEEGWVEIPNINAMAPIDLSKEGASKVGDTGVESWDEVPTVIKKGQVEFRKL